MYCSWYVLKVKISTRLLLVRTNKRNYFLALQWPDPELLPLLIPLLSQTSTCRKEQQALSSSHQRGCNGILFTCQNLLYSWHLFQTSHSNKTFPGHITFTEKEVAPVSAGRVSAGGITANLSLDVATFSVSFIAASITTWKTIIKVPTFFKGKKQKPTTEQPIFFRATKRHSNYVYIIISYQCHTEAWK